jgi:hypothetical protein
VTGGAIAVDSEQIWHGRAFGLDVDTSFPVSGLPSREGEPTGRRVSLELIEPRELDRVWRQAGETSLLDRRDPAGRLVMSIESDSTLGFRIYAPRYGRHLISPDGRRVRSVLPRVAPWRWQRLLFAQVLPLATSLQGLGVFHASAVAVEGTALAFIAASGTGKTSLAVHLVDRGAALLTDDVLALEGGGPTVLAHHGAAFASVAQAELDAVSPVARRQLGAVAGKNDKVLVTPRVGQTSVPLRAVYFLSRMAEPGEIVIERSDPPDPLLLLSANFISYVPDPSHLRRHLDLCAQIAETAGIHRVEIPTGTSAAAVADAVLAHSRGEGQ